MRTAKIAILFAACLATALAAACGETTDPLRPSADPGDAAFGYTNGARSKLLMLVGEGQAREDKLKLLQTAVCSDGFTLPIRYAGFQKRGPDDNGRQSIYNFENDEGPLFEVTGTQTRPPDVYLGDTCLLVPAGYLSSFPIVPNDLPSAELEERETLFDKISLEADQRKQSPDLTSFQPADAFGKDAVARIEREKGRKVKSYWLLHRVGKSEQVAAVEFESAGENLLASVVLVEPDRLAFFDMPATNKGGDCWRVSDGCRLDPGRMHIPLVLGHPGDQLVMFGFQGEEGLLTILLQARGDKLVEILRAGQYQLPV